MVQIRLVFISIVLINFSILSQDTKIYYSKDKNILVFNEVNILFKDTFQHFRLSKIAVIDEFIYTETTSSIMLRNDTIIGVYLERNVNEGRKISKSLIDSCDRHEVISTNEINKILENVICLTLKRAEENILNNNKESKKYLEFIQQIMLLINDEKLDFLNEYCMYINLDLISLESQFIDSKFKNDKYKMFLISQAFRINTFDKKSRIDFEAIWLELFYKLKNIENQEIFSRNQFKKIRNIFNEKDVFYLLDENCWVGYL